jgi:hypothetical protein
LKRRIKELNEAEKMQNHEGLTENCLDEAGKLTMDFRRELQSMTQVHVQKIEALELQAA